MYEDSSGGRCVISCPLLSVTTSDALPSEKLPWKLLRRVESGSTGQHSEDKAPHICLHYRMLIYLSRSQLSLRYIHFSWVRSTFLDLKGKQARSGTRVHIIHEEATLAANQPRSGQSGEEAVCCAPGGSSLCGFIATLFDELQSYSFSAGIPRSRGISEN